MILGKYQHNDERQDRGYSATCVVTNEDGKHFFAKWIKGIAKDSQQSKILSNKLRHLKKADHSSLPKLIEYGWDETFNAYCIVFEYIASGTLEEEVNNISPIYFLKGIHSILEALEKLQQSHRISHGDITPANILVNPDNNQFYIIDFGIADIAETLSQKADLEIFAKAFAAPEKFDTGIERGFGFQEDIYSIGKVVDWYFQRRGLESEGVKSIIDSCCRKEPSQRRNFGLLMDDLTLINKIVSFDGNNLVLVKGGDTPLLRELNKEELPPVFSVSANEGKNIKIFIATQNYFVECLWLLADEIFTVLGKYHKDTESEKYERTKKRGRPLNLAIEFVPYSNFNLRNQFSLTPILKNVFLKKQQEQDYQRGKRQSRDELGFYKALIEKEKEVLFENSLRLKYSKFDMKGEDGIHFSINLSDKFSQEWQIYNHIDKATPPNPEEFEYILSDTADKKQMKGALRFTGVAFNFNKKYKTLKFKDCEKLDFEKIPNNGYLFENISWKEEEKKRQEQAIRKVEYNEMQNRALIHYLFNPKELEGKYLIQRTLDKVFQVDASGKPFVYSPNQEEAIINALYRKPLTVIQGPPGTGKTTVITEIVFQLLDQKPDVKILITSQTNDAVDNVLDNLLEKEIPFVRLSGKRKPKVSLAKHTLERKIEGWKEEVFKKTNDNWAKQQQLFRESLKGEEEYQKLQAIFDILQSGKKWNDQQRQIVKVLNQSEYYKELQNHLEIHTDFIPALNNLIKVDIEQYFKEQEILFDWLTSVKSLKESSTLNQKLINSIQVFGATTNHVAAKKYAKYNLEFDYVIMDESGKATTAESLVPLVLAENAILVGDHRQLRPMLTSTREVEKWLRREYSEDNKDFDSWDDYFNRSSLFEQVIEGVSEDFRSQLDVCRRCTEEQVGLISKCFYEPFGDTPIKFVPRSADKEHQLDLKTDGSIVFLDIGRNARSEQDRGGSSYNEVSAKLIPEILTKLDKYSKVKDYSIGVITGYTAQLKKIKSEVNKNRNLQKTKNIRMRSDQVSISVVDRFQGLEKDIIIFDLVRNGSPSLGFLANANRINVALSRQKKLLIIIGGLDSILSAKPPKSAKDKSKPALQKYLELLVQKGCVVKNLDQIF